MTDVSVFLMGISTAERLGVVRFVAQQGVASMSEVAREWPAVPTHTLGGAASVLVRSGWLLPDGPTTRRATVVEVSPAAPRRLWTLLEELDPASRACEPVDVEDVLADLSVLRREATRDVLARLAARDWIAAHPRELGLTIERAWAGWTALHRAGWMADGRLVLGRTSSLRTLAVELVRAVAA